MRVRGYGVREVGGLHRFVTDGNAEDPGHRLGDLVVTHLDRTVKRVDLAVVWFGVLQYRRDDMGLVFGSDRCVAAVAHGEPQQTLVTTAKPEPAQPFSEE